MRSTFILDPLWVTKGTYLDPEYFNYILLDASMKYQKELDNMDFSRFYEVLFHCLNLNSLVVNGSLYNGKLKEIWSTPRIEQIRKELKDAYGTGQSELNEGVLGDVGVIVKNASFVFMSLLLDYLNTIMSVIEEVRLFHINPAVHKEKVIFILTNTFNSDKYTVWKLEMDPKKNLGYSFKSICVIKSEGVEEQMLSAAIEQAQDLGLEGLSIRDNFCLAMIANNERESQVAMAIKDLIMLNKGIVKKDDFEGALIPEFYRHLWTEKILPFTVDAWMLENETA